MCAAGKALKSWQCIHSFIHMKEAKQVSALFRNLASKPHHSHKPANLTTATIMLWIHLSINTDPAVLVCEKSKLEKSLLKDKNWLCSETKEDLAGASSSQRKAFFPPNIHRWNEWISWLNLTFDNAVKHLGVFRKYLQKRKRMEWQTWTIWLRNWLRYATHSNGMAI